MAHVTGCKSTIQAGLQRYQGRHRDSLSPARKCNGIDCTVNGAELIVPGPILHSWTEEVTVG